MTRINDELNGAFEEKFRIILTSISEEVKTRLLRGPLHIVIIIEIEQKRENEIDIRHHVGQKEYQRVKVPKTGL